MPKETGFWQIASDHKSHFFSIYGPPKHPKSKYHKLITSEPSKIRKVTVFAILNSCQYRAKATWNMPFLAYPGKEKITRSLDVIEKCTGLLCKVVDSHDYRYMKAQGSLATNHGSVGISSMGQKVGLDSH